MHSPWSMRPQWGARVTRWGACVLNGMRAGVCRRAVRGGGSVSAYNLSSTLPPPLSPPACVCVCVRARDCACASTCVRYMYISCRKGRMRPGPMVNRLTDGQLLGAMVNRWGRLPPPHPTPFQPMWKRGCASETPPPPPSIHVEEGTSPPLPHPKSSREGEGQLFGRGADRGGGSLGEPRSPNFDPGSKFDRNGARLWSNVKAVKRSGKRVNPNLNPAGRPTFDRLSVHRVDRPAAGGRQAVRCASVRGAFAPPAGARTRRRPAAGGRRSAQHGEGASAAGKGRRRRAAAIGATSTRDAAAAAAAVGYFNTASIASPVWCV